MEPRRGQEHEFEAQLGLPEKLPADERILWQGQPLPWLVARRVFHLPLLTGYFSVMLVWRVLTQRYDGATWLEALQGSVGLAALSLLALGILAFMAHMAARTTVYTLTDKRVVMRIGIVLTVTYNLPLRSIDAAHLLPLANGHGEIALALRGDTRIAYLQLWPHARPWHVKNPQPMLRGLADAKAVSERLGQAWSMANALPARGAESNRPMSKPAQPLAHPGAAGLTTHGSAA